MLFVSAVECWRPRTANALRDYWRGSWRLTKQMTYERGGISGTFNGRATFAPLDQGNSSTWLAYADSGVATLGDDTLEARNSLLYECSSADEIRCFFDDAGPSAGAYTPLQLNPVTGRRQPHTSTQACVLTCVSSALPRSRGRSRPCGAPVPRDHRPQPGAAAILRASVRAGRLPRPFASGAGRRFLLRLARQRPAQTG